MDRAKSLRFRGDREAQNREAQNQVHLHRVHLAHQGLEGLRIRQDRRDRDWVASSETHALHPVPRVPGVRFRPCQTARPMGESRTWVLLPSETVGRERKRSHPRSCPNQPSAFHRAWPGSWTRFRFASSLRARLAQIRLAQTREVQTHRVCAAAHQRDRRTNRDLRSHSENLEKQCPKVPAGLEASRVGSR